MCSSNWIEIGNWIHGLVKCPLNINERVWKDPLDCLPASQTDRDIQTRHESCSFPSSASCLSFSSYYNKQHLVNMLSSRTVAGKVAHTLRSSSRSCASSPGVNRMLQNNRRMIQRMTLHSSSVTVSMLHNVTLQSPSSCLLLDAGEDEDGT